MTTRVYNLIGLPLTAVMTIPFYIMAAATPVTAGSAVSLTLTPAAQTIKAGETLDMVIQVESGDQEVVGVDAYLDFDPAQLEVEDQNTDKDGVQISGGETLSTVIQNSADNTAGHINYSAGVLGAEAYPKGTILVATVRFKALVEAASTAVTFSTADTRTTMVSGPGGTDITGPLSSANYAIKGTAGTVSTAANNSLQTSTGSVKSSPAGSAAAVEKKPTGASTAAPASDSTSAVPWGLIGAIIAICLLATALILRNVIRKRSMKS